MGPTIFPAQSIYPNGTMVRKGFQHGTWDVIAIGRAHWSTGDAYPAKWSSEPNRTTAEALAAHLDAHPESVTAFFSA